MEKYSIHIKCAFVITSFYRNKEGTVFSSAFSIVIKLKKEEW